MGRGPYIHNPSCVSTKDEMNHYWAVSTCVEKIAHDRQHARKDSDMPCRSRDFPGNN